MNRKGFGFRLTTVSLGVLVSTFAVMGVAGAVQKLRPLADECSDRPLRSLELHDGFQEAPRCVDTEFGAVTTARKNPSLLITKAPAEVAANTDFDLSISTRNLVRDRFLAAGQGGYYLESSLLNNKGLTRGHFHVACRVIGSTNEAPDPAPVPAFFKAVEDGGGGFAPDTVVVRVVNAKLPAGATVQCSAWAGDGSHRTPMMERANQTPAFDSVRIQVR